MADSKIIIQLINKNGQRAVIIEETIKDAIERACFEYPYGDWETASIKFLAMLPKKYHNHILALET